MNYLAGLTSLLLTTIPAQAQVFDLEAFLALLETDHSPLLVPLSYDSVDQVDSRLTLRGVDFGGFALDEVAFDLRAVGGAQVLLDNFNFPAADDLRADMDEEDELVWEAPSLSIVYNMKDEAPDQIEFDLAPLAILEPSNGLDFALDGLSLSMSADKDAGTMALDVQTGSGQFAVQDDYDDFRFTLPSLSLSWSETEYSEGTHPFAGLRAQLGIQSAQFQSHEDPTQSLSNLITTIEDLELPNASNIELQVSGFEFNLPRDGFTITAGPTMARMGNNDMQNPRQTTGFLSWTIDDVTFSTSDGISASIDQIFLEGSAEQTDSVRLISAFNSPTFATLASLMDDAALVPTLRVNRAWRDFLLRPDLSTTVENLFKGFGKQDISYGLRDASLNLVMFPMNLGEFVTEVRFDTTTTDQASTGMTLRYADLDIPILQVIDATLAEVLPTNMHFDFDVSRVDLADLVDRFAGLADSDLDPSLDVTTQVLEMIAAWWQATGAVFSPEAQLDSQATRITLAGTFPFDSDAAFGLTGGADVSISNFSEVKALASSLTNSPDPNIAGSAFGAVTALELLGQFGEIDSKGTLALDVKLDASGATTVNGLPLPF